MSHGFIRNVSSSYAISASAVSGGMTYNNSGSILAPTSSGVPTFTGTNGQFIFGTTGGNHYIYVWMSGAWKSSSLF